MKPRALLRWIFPALWLGFVAVAFSDAGISIEALATAFWGGAAVAAFWAGRLLVRLALRLLARRRGGAPVELRAWPEVPATLLLSALLIVSGALPWARFRLSRPALERYARRVAAEGPAAARRGRVGLYALREVELLPGGGLRMITCEDMLDDAGLAYVPAGPPPRLGKDGYTPLGGPWWRWRRSW